MESIMDLKESKVSAWHRFLDMIFFTQHHTFPGYPQGLWISKPFDRTMTALYLFLIALASLPMLATLKRIVRYRAIQKSGITTMGTVTGIHTGGAYKGGSYDKLTVSYLNQTTGQPEVGQTSAVSRKYRVGDRIPVAYKDDNPTSLIPMDRAGFGSMLVFSIVLFLFVVFSIYKIRETVEFDM
jgi:hypothetical protein